MSELKLRRREIEALMPYVNDPRWAGVVRVPRYSITWIDPGVFAKARGSRAAVLALAQSGMLPTGRTLPPRRREPVKCHMCGKAMVRRIIAELPPVIHCNDPSGASLAVVAQALEAKLRGQRVPAQWYRLCPHAAEESASEGCCEASWWPIDARDVSCYVEMKEEDTTEDDGDDTATP